MVVGYFFFGEKLPKDFLEKNLKFNIGHGHSIFFRHASWSDVGIIKDIFLELFVLSLLQDVSLSEMGGWIGGKWQWGDFGIIDSSNPSLEVVRPALCELLPAPNSGLKGVDAAHWLLTADGAFSVSLSYKELLNYCIPFGPFNRYDCVFSNIWLVYVPLKVKAFGWRCFKNKIPTRDSLMLRGILDPSSNLSCSFCEEFEETLSHSFLCCSLVVEVWKDMA